jgi:hypothetical protein
LREEFYKPRKKQPKRFKLGGKPNEDKLFRKR